MKKFSVLLAFWLLGMGYTVFKMAYILTQPYPPHKFYHIRGYFSEQQKESLWGTISKKTFTNTTSSLPTASTLSSSQAETDRLRDTDSPQKSLDLYLLEESAVHGNATKNLSTLHPPKSNRSHLNTSLNVSPLLTSQENGSSLVPDEYYLVDIALKIGVDMCFDVFMDPYYKELRDLYMNAWHRFVPKQSEMNSANCWYHNNINELPHFTAQNMKKLDDLYKFQQKFDAKKILNMTFFNVIKEDNSSTKLTVSHHSHFCIPNIYIVGFHKSGTTLLYEYIKRHPLFAPPHTKESAFWRSIVSTKFDSSTLEMGVLIYLYHFFDAAIQMRDTPDMFTIDASASTVFATAKPLREAKKDVCFVPLVMAETMPRTKILVSMRNPIDRLWSGFLYFCPQKKWEYKKRVQKNFLQIVASTFHTQVVDAMKKFHSCIHQNNSLFHCTAIIGSYASPDIHCNKVRLGIGMYYVHLVKWFSVFPREQIHVIKYDDLAANPSSTVDQAFEFLGIPHDLNSEAIQKNVKSNGWEKDFKMLPKTRELLAKFYHPYNVKLAEFLEDKDFMWDET